LQRAIVSRHPLKCCTLTTLLVSSIYRYALCTRGVVYSWGRGRYGALGQDDSEKDHIMPVRIDGLNANVINRIACGRWHCVVLANNPCRLFGWGRNNAGQLGLGVLSRACTKPIVVHITPDERMLNAIRDLAAGMPLLFRTAV